MLMLSRHRVFFRCVSLLTALTFLPNSVDAWYFLPQIQAVVLAAEEGPIPLAPDKVAELESGEEAPVQLSQEHREQLAENSVPPEVAPLAPESPQLAQAEGAATALAVGATPAPGTGGLKALSREELQQATAGPRVITDNPYDAGLPEVADILSRMNSAKQEQEAARVQVAQAGDVPPPTPGQEADAALLAAAALKENGHYSESIMAYVHVMESYPNDPIAVKQADRGIVQFVKDIKAGTLTREQLAEFETTLETWTPGNVQAGYGALTYLGRRAEEEQDGGGGAQVYQDYARRTINLAARVIVLDPYHYKQLGVTDYYYVSAKRLAPSDGASAMQALAESTQGLPSSMGRLSANFVLANFEGIMNNNRGMATVYRANLLEDARAEFVQQTFTNPSVEPWLKGMLGNVIGGAYWSLGDYDGAITFYESTLPYMSDAGSTREMVELSIAQAKADKFNKNPEEAVRGYNEFLAKFPNGKRAPQALIQLAAIYMTAGDYHGAADLYSEVVQRWPETEWGISASAELTYIFENLYESTPVAGLIPTESEQEMAMRCGPEALALLLSQKGVEATVDELAALAGTDATGTSMLGLVQAAEYKGVKVSGVTATAIDDLKAPYIAYVNGDHFVLVTALHADNVSIVDKSQGARTIARSAFAAMWNGKALVLDDRGVEQLELAELQAARGGAGSGTSGDKDPPCTDPCCDPDGGGSNSSGGGSGGKPCSTPDDKAGSPNSPAANLGISGPGVTIPKINTFESALKLNERDLSIPVRGALNLSFARSYINEKGKHRGEYTSTTKPWMNNVGSGWTHNLNAHLRVATGATPAYVTVYNADGSGTSYDYDSTSGGYDWYYRHVEGQTGEKGNTLKRNTTTLAFTLEKASGMIYEFSPATSDAYAFARLESFRDNTGNTITLTYDGANGTGKLTKATSPTGDYTLNMAYSGTLITKVELKKSSTVINSVSYAYLSDELTKVTDHASKTVKYAYDSYLGNGRYITKITDKANRATDLAWDWYTGGLGEATKITVTNVAGLTTKYERSHTSNVATITNLDGITQLSKMVNTPVSSSDVARSKFHDYYTGVSTYERWEYQYDGSNNMTRLLAPDGSTYTTLSYNLTGQLASQRRGSGPTEYWYYDSSGLLLTRHVDRAGIEVNFYYNANGLRTKYTHPSLAAAGTRYAYDGYGQITRETSALGSYKDREYDLYGKMTKEIRDTGGLEITSAFFYDDLGNPTRYVDSRNKESLFYYSDAGCGGCDAGGQLTKISNALGGSIEWQYDAKGLMTKSIDAAGVETAYEFDAMGRPTKVVFPAGGASYGQFFYSLLGQLTTTVELGGYQEHRAYDHVGRITLVSDSVGDINYRYNSLGLLTEVVDALAHSTNYAYDGALSLTKETDAIGKTREYAYDSSGRSTKVGAGSGGSVDPTSRFYNIATGLLTKVEYTSGTYAANYLYDGGGRLTMLTDWLGGGNGLGYAYDAAGRLTELTDYDSSTLTYSYDDMGNVLSMIDYHGNTTTYTYNDLGQLSTLTAPGSRTWTYGYGVGARLTRLDIPNGMHTLYSYDAMGRLTSIYHKDGATAQQSFDYIYNAGNNITKTTQEDGSYWSYEYDGRERLTKAERGNQSSPTILATYQYSYDAGDNILSKVGPWIDDFQDGNISGWSGDTGYFSVSGGVMKNTSDASFRGVYLSETDADQDLSFDYIRYSAANRADHILRYTDSNNALTLAIEPTKVVLRQIDGGTNSTPGTYTTTVAQNTWYTVRVVMNGGSVKVYWGEKGGTFNEVLSVTGITETTTTRAAYFRAQGSSEHGWDNIQVIAGSRSTVETFTYNNANEQTAHAKNGVTTTMAYDAWGRLTSRDDSTHDATYVYRYGSKLYSVTSDFPDEGNVTYETGGDGKRRSRVAGASEAWYNYTAGHDVVSVENKADGSTGALVLSNVIRAPQSNMSSTLADLAGASPAIGTARYYNLDHLGSVRSVSNAAKSISGRYEYSPFGGERSHSGESLDKLAGSFTGKQWDASSQLILFPYRAYSPSSGRWQSRDPLGMIDSSNVYSYVRNSPLQNRDPDGQDIFSLGGDIWNWCRGKLLGEAKKKALGYVERTDGMKKHIDVYKDLEKAKKYIDKGKDTYDDLSDTMPEPDSSDWGPYDVDNLPLDSRYPASGRYPKGREATDKAGELVKDVMVNVNWGTQLAGALDDNFPSCPSGTR